MSIPIPPHFTSVPLLPLGAQRGVKYRIAITMKSFVAATATLAFATTATARTFTVVNNCAYTVWPGVCISFYILPIARRLLM